MSTRLLPLLLCLIVCSVPAIAQTVPDEQPDSPSQKAATKTKRFDKAESIRRIREAREILRKGDFLQAAARLEDDKKIVRFDCCIDPRESSVASAIVYLAREERNLALKHAEWVHRQKQRGVVNVEAGLLKTLIYAQADLQALAQKWGRWTYEADPEIALAALIAAKLEEQGGAYELAESTTNPDVPGSLIEIWTGGEESPQPVLFAFSNRQSFIGALVLSRAKPEDGPPQYNFVYTDFAASPLLVLDFGSSSPPVEALKKLAVHRTANLTGNQRYSTVRAEFEAFVARQKRITPLAAWWSAYAARNKSKLGAEIQSSLEGAGESKWKTAGTVEAGQFHDPVENRTVNLYAVTGYANSKMLKRGDLKEGQDPPELYHFAVFATQRAGEYMGSFVFTLAEGRPGEFRYVLVRQKQEDRQFMEVYDEPPTYDALSQDVVKNLEEQLRASRSQITEPTVGSIE